MKKVLSIAGSDCSGGAGIQADLKTFSAHGVFGMSVIVSVVAENTSRVIDIQDITPDMIKKQIDAVFEDITVDAVKIGMLSTPRCMNAVAEKLMQYRPENVVIDPVMYAKNGSPLMEPTAVDTLVKEIIPLADVLTPNIPEAEKIADMQILSVTDMEIAAKKIAAMGCKAIVVKGGHAIGNALDVLYDGENVYHFETKRIDTKNTHGTGCTFSSAIASQLAKGLSIREAVQKSKEYVTTAIEHSLAIGHGNGPTNHFYDLYKNGLQGWGNE
ncbi:MAG: bifunctional hydroxymethylpyrimidine kinase/phosphomethylpyrimidine kinase [Anaerocolumna sp.]